MPATTPRSCVIRMTLVPVSSSSCRDQLENLRLNRHVERGRRLVGDQQLRAGTTAPSRSSRAGACRRRTRADSRRRAVRASGMPTVSSMLHGVLVRLARSNGRDAARVTSISCFEMRMNGIQRRHRILEDHRDPLAADRRESRCRTASADPCRRTEPRRRRCGPAGVGMSRMIDRFVTDLPEPDSPTMPSVSPRARSKDTPSTALTTRSSSSKYVRRLRTDRRLVNVVSAFSHLRIERVAQAVAEEVQREQRDRPS